MLRLYIDNKEVDLSEDISIAFTYKSIDTDTPVADKNSYSKSVSLKGTPNNNEIFSNAWDVSRDVVEGSFDPKKRVDFTLYDNGDIIEYGYVHLDEVNLVGNDITYTVTLYGQLGDMFYSLMYDEEGKERTLASLKYGFSDVDDEDKRLMLWSKAYISNSWYKLKYGADDHMSIDYNITAVPTYSGYYEDFDSNKAIVKYSSLSDEAKSILGSISGISGKTKDGYVLIEGQRDMDEWEIGDLRSVHQRPAIRTSIVMNAISNPINNGGYTIKWDDSIRNSAYFKDSWIMFNRFDFDADETANSATPLELDDNIWRTGNNDVTVDLKTVTGGVKEFDFSDMENPVVNVSVMESIALDKAFNKIYSHTDKYIYSTVYEHTVKHSMYGAWRYRLDVYVDGVYLKSSADYIMSTADYSVSNARLGNMFTLGGCGISKNKVNIIPTSTEKTKLHQWEKPVTISVSIPAVDKVTVKLVKDYAVCDVADGSIYPDVLFNKTSGAKDYAFACNSTVYDDEENDIQVNGYYDGAVNPNIQKTVVNKKILFADSETPYKYLVGLTKAMGCRFIAEQGEKVVHIVPRDKFYIDDVIDLDSKIDRSQEIKVKPSTCEYKWYEYGYETPETYAWKLYKKNEKDTYGRLKIDTGYHFNNESKDLFEEVVYKSAIPYKHNSIYFNRIGGLEPLFLTPYLDVTYYTGTTKSEESKQIKGYDDYRHLKQLKDGVSKLCCFDSDNGNVDDITNCLVFFDGMSGEYVRISNSFESMIELNDNPCYLYTDQTEHQESVEFPVFSKYLTDSDGVYTDSLDFKKPERTFIGDISNYQDNITMYDRYWKGFIDDLYERNSRSITLKCFLPEKPHTAIRKFYYFDRSVWAISEITDWSPEEDLTQVTFVKVYDISNYTARG